MTPIDAQVRAGWLAFCAPLEGGAEVDVMFRDIRGLVTTGEGILIDSPHAAAAIRWVRADGSPAALSDVAAEWWRVKALPPARVWSYYSGAAHGAALRLAPGEVERITLDRLDADVEVLTRRWPAFGSFPAPAQAAILALAWAVGPGSTGAGITNPHEWPHFDADVDRQDWRACAVAGQLRWSDNPGARPRDLCVSALFLLAAGASDEEARAGWPPGPTAAAAGRALDGLGLRTLTGDEPTLDGTGGG